MLVVARDDERVAGRVHAHHQAQHAGAVGAAVDQVADEHRPPVLRRQGVDRAALLVAGDGVAEAAEQRQQLGQAAVHVADDVERAVLGPPVGQQRLAHHLDLVDVVAAQHVHAPEALAGEAAQRPPEQVVVAAHDPLAEVAVGTGRVAPHRLLDRHVEHDGHRQHVVGPRQLDQAAARLAGDVGGVDDRQASGVETQAGHVVQRVEGRHGGVLGALVVAHHAAVGVAREHLVAAEVLLRERRLARARDADEDDQRQVGQRDPPHAGTSLRRNRASWVGAPCSGFASPTPRTSTS